MSFFCFCSSEHKNIFQTNSNTNVSIDISKPEYLQTLHTIELALFLIYRDLRLINNTKVYSEFKKKKLTQNTLSFW